MALNNVPLAGQSLAVTRAPINNNFATINTAFSVDHVEYNTADQGQHKKVTFPVQLAAPAFAAGSDGLYNLLYATTNKNELFVHHQTFAGTSDIPLTASILSTSTPGALTAGWTYLPSGLILKWSANIVANGQTTIIFPASATIPAFTTCLTVLLTVADGAGGDVDEAIRLTGVAAANFSVYASPRVTTGAKAVTFTYLAIGY